MTTVTSTSASSATYGVSSSTFATATFHVPAGATRTTLAWVFAGHSRGGTVGSDALCRSPISQTCAFLRSDCAMWSSVQFTMRA